MSRYLSKAACKNSVAGDLTLGMILRNLELGGSGSRSNWDGHSGDAN
jgi:hypothetical protein